MTKFVLVRNGKDAPEEIVFYGKEFVLGGEAVELEGQAEMKAKGNKSFREVPDSYKPPFIPKAPSVEDVADEEVGKDEPKQEEATYKDMVTYINSKGLKVISKKADDVEMQYKSLLEDEADDAEVEIEQA